MTDKLIAGADLATAARPGVPDSPPIQWFHSHDFGDEVTPGVKPLSIIRQEADLILADHVKGRSVLDIGAWDGFFSFEAERRGASDVLATDHFCWSGPGWGTKAGFDHAHARFGSKVRSLDVDVFDLSPAVHGTFDVVLFLGVLYHLKDPFGGLEKAAAMCRELLVVETAADMTDISEPVMRYYLGSELNGDPTNFWAPNAPCLEAMLRELGFRRFELTMNTPEKRTRLTMHAWR